MHRIDIQPLRRGPLAALVFLLAVGACDTPATPPSVQARVFRVAEADNQTLPAHQSCPATADGMTTGTYFVEGELTLYPETAFSWRFTIEQYVIRNGDEQVWVQPFDVTGTYAVRGDSIDLMTPDGPTRAGRLVGGAVELSEVVPCRFPVGEDAVHETALYLTEERS